MRFLVIAVLAVCCAVSAKPRTELTKVVKSDTMVTMSPDSVRLAWEDTLKITTLFQDTSLIVKKDTLKTHSVSRIVPKPVKK